MTRFPRSVFLFAAALFAATSLLTAADAAKPRVAILEFKNKTEGYAWAWYRAGEAAQDMFVTELVRKGNFRVMER
jgi:curli biogenesis system outer membrane secretion channel CsgG